MAMVGARSGRLLEGQVFAPVEIEQVRDGGVLVGAVQQHAAGDLDRGAERDGVGGKPPGRVHGTEDLLLAADQSDIDGVTGNALRSPRDHRQVGKPLLVLIVSPEGGQHHVGDGGIGRDQGH